MVGIAKHKLSRLEAYAVFIEIGAVLGLVPLDLHD